MMPRPPAAPLLLGLALLGSLPAAAAPLIPPLVANGGLEAETVTAGTPAVPPPGWSVSGTGVTVDTVFPNGGTYDVAFTAAATDANAGVLSQVVATTAGTGYVLSFAALDQAGFAGDRLLVAFGGFSAVIPGNTIAAPGTLPSFYTPETFAIPAGAVTGRLTTLSFQGLNAASGIAINVDDVVLRAVSVPEPPAAWLLVPWMLAWLLLAAPPRRRG